MLQHVTLSVSDLARADESWSRLVGELGYLRDPAVDRFLLFRRG